ncbi:MAG: serine protease [Acidimicrobiia bacterium]|nr:serine protease [Acidimicrobiia bacterium]
MKTTPRRRRLSLGLAIVVVLALAAPVRAITSQHPSDADVGEYPYAVALVDAGGDSYDGQFCGGTLIDPTHVLTAAHCVTAQGGQIVDPASVEAVIGQTNLTSSDGERIVAVGIAVHPDFDPWNAANDMAIIELSAPASVTPAGIGDASVSAAGTGATVVGWGQDAQGGHPEDLQEADVTLVGDDECSEAFEGEFDPDSMLCAGDSRPGGEGDSCYGDSGGPLVVQTDEGAKVVGVVSWGYECDGDFPGVYAEVASSGEWIAGVLDGTIEPETEGVDRGAGGGFPGGGEFPFPGGDFPGGGEFPFPGGDFPGGGEFPFPGGDFPGGGEFPGGDAPWGDAPFDDELTDEMLAEIQAIDRALMEALDEAGIDYEVVEDELGAYPMFDDTDPAVWDIVDAVYEEHFGGGLGLPGGGWDEPLPGGDGDAPPADEPWGEPPGDGWDEGPVDDAPLGSGLDEAPVDDDLAELQALDAALIAALEEAGIPFEIVEDGIGAYPVFDETDPAAWDVVESVYGDLFGTDGAADGDGWDEEWDDAPVDDGWDDTQGDDGWDAPDVTDDEIAEMQAEDAALMAALDAAGIPYVVEVDDIGPYPVLDEDDPAVQAFLEDYYG